MARGVEEMPAWTISLTITVGHIHSYIQRETRAEREKSPDFFLTSLNLSSGWAWAGKRIQTSLSTMITHYPMFMIILPSGPDPGLQSCQGPSLPPGQFSFLPPGSRPWLMQDRHQLHEKGSGRAMESIIRTWKRFNSVSVTSSLEFIRKEKLEQIQ